MFNKRIRDRICDMSKTLAVAKDTNEFMADMVQFYKDFGVGKLDFTRLSVLIMTRTAEQ